MSHPISDSLVNLSPKEQHRTKARAYAALSGQAGRSLTRGKYKVTLTADPTFEDDMLVFYVRVTKGNKDVTPSEWDGPDGKPGRVRIYQPQIWIDDPNGDIVVASTDPRVPGSAKFREDLPACLMDMAGNLARLLP